MQTAYQRRRCVPRCPPLAVVSGGKAVVAGGGKPNSPRKRNHTSPTTPASEPVHHNWLGSEMEQNGSNKLLRRGSGWEQRQTAGSPSCHGCCQLPLTQPNRSTPGIKTAKSIHREGITGYRRAAVGRLQRLLAVDPEIPAMVRLLAVDIPPPLATYPSMCTHSLSPSVYLSLSL